jgi:glucose/mannose-6-phosphate isomerase
MDHYRHAIETFGSQLTSHGLLPSRLSSLSRKKYDGIVIAGMGGSGLAGDLLASLRKTLHVRVPVFTTKDYGLPEPPAPLRSPLYIFVSFSGNTEEVLSGARAHLAQRPRRGGAAFITTGGMLAGIAERNRLPLVVFDAETLTPRQATGKMFYSLTEILHAARLLPRRLGPESLSSRRFDAPGRTLARQLRKQLIVIYTPESERSLGYIWKIKFNETAKVPAFSNVIPEMNHNEIVGFSSNSFPTTALFIHEPTLAGRMKKRIAVTKRLVQGTGARVITIPLTGKTSTQKMWNSIMLADWTSYHLSLSMKHDPAETRIIDKLKRAMRA